MCTVYHVLTISNVNNPVPNRTVRCCTILDCNVMDRTVLFRPVLSCTELYCTVLRKVNSAKSGD